MTFPSFDIKDPNDVDIFTLDWSDELETGETISSYSFPDFPSGLTRDSDSNTTTTVTATISGGTAGESYDITYRIVTSAGRTLDQSVTLPVAEQ